MDRKTLLVWIGIVFNISNSQSASLVGDCAKTQCYNDGLCHVLQNGFQVCICKKGWAGADCSIDIDECLADYSACAVGETCTNTPGGFRCDCLSPGRCKSSVPQDNKKNKRLLIRTFATPPPPTTATVATTQSPPPFTTKAPPTPPDIKTPSPITIQHTTQPTGSPTSTVAPPSIPVG